VLQALTIHTILNLVQVVIHTIFHLEDCK